MEIDVKRDRYPYCIVWTPIPLISWLIPLIGHMGIATSSGVIRDFAGPYYVSEDDMAFGKPTKYWQLLPELVIDGQQRWDDSVRQASDCYSNRMHNLFCDNCHSHVSMALNLMKYNGKCNYNMISTLFFFILHSKYVSFWRFLKTWIPFVLIISIIVIVLVVIR